MKTIKEDNKKHPLIKAAKAKGLNDVFISKDGGEMWHLESREMDAWLGFTIKSALKAISDIKATS